MTDTFTASNGYTVEKTNGGRLDVTDTTRVTLSDVATRTSRTVYISADMVPVLAEYFEAEADRLAGRWRFKADPRYVVFPGYSQGEQQRFVRIVNEMSGATDLIYEKTAMLHPVADAYFTAHPEPKPWHDAKPGEVWVIEQANAATTAARAGMVNERMKFEPVDNITRHIDVDDPIIVGARRIWPEDAS